MNTSANASTKPKLATPQIESVLASNSLTTFVDHFLPDFLTQASPEKLRRARLTLVMCLFAIIAQSIGALFSVYVDFAVSIYPPLLSLVILLPLPILLKKTGSLALVSNLIVFALMGCVFAAAFLDRGIQSPPIAILGGICFIAIICAGRTWGLIWTLSALGCLAILGMLEMKGTTFDGALDNKQQLIFSWVLNSVLITCLSLLGIVYETLKARAVDELRELSSALEKAYKEAFEAERSKAEMLANVSHEIRTPMNGIIGMIELLRASSLNSEQEESVETIHRSAQSLRALLNDVIDMRRIEEGRFELEQHSFDLGEVIEDVAGLMAGLAIQKSIELQVRIQPSAPRHVLGDAHRLRQVLSNLLGNALKFTDQGSVKLELQGKAILNCAQLCLRVKDTGIGIAQESLANIFGKFVQANKSTSRIYGGSGLGLAISHQIIKRMGGSLEVHSILGEGSCFWFDLTLPIDSAAEQKIPKLEGEAFLFGENPQVRGFHRELLEYWGLEVSEYSANPTALLSALQKTKPRFWIFDENHQQSLLPLLSKLDEADLKRCFYLWQGFSRPESLPAQVTLLRKPARRKQFREALGGSTAQKNIKSHGLRRLVYTDREILIVDDNLTNVLVTSKIMTRLGCRCTTAANGREAVDLVRDKKFDLVFMDCQMPVLDGFEATKEIRELEKNSATKTPIVALTASVMPKDIVRCQEVGMNAVLSKPLELTAVKDILRRFVVSANEEQENTESKE